MFHQIGPDVYHISVKRIFFVLSVNRRSPNILQQLTSTNVISQSDCKTMLNGLKITSKMICAYDIKAGFCDVSDR